MSERRQQASHVMGAGTSLHYNRACMKSSEELDQLPAPELLAKYRFAPSILTVKVEGVRSQIDANYRDVLHDSLQSGIDAVSVAHSARAGGTIPLLSTLR
jgi:hypothetical protein